MTLARRWPILLGAIAAGIGLAALVILATPVRYESSSRLVFTETASVQAPPELNQPRAIDNEAHFLRSDRVTGSALAATGDDTSQVSVRVDPVEDAITVSGRAAEPQTAQVLTATLVETFVVQRRQSLLDQHQILVASGGDEQDQFVNQIGHARLGGDDAEVARLEALRDGAQAARDQVTDEARSLRIAAGVKISEPASLPIGPIPRWRSWRVPAVLLAPLGIALAATHLALRRPGPTQTYPRIQDPYDGLPDTGIEWNPHSQTSALDALPTWTAPEPDPPAQTDAEPTPLRRVAPPRASAAKPATGGPSDADRGRPEPIAPRRISPPRSTRASRTPYPGRGV